MRRLAVILAGSLAFAGAGCAREIDAPETPVSPATTTPAETQLATFGGGCFWCTDAVFRRLEGVVSVESGYSGGTVESPTYEQVCSKTTGHAEVIQVRFDPAKVSYEQLLEVFFRTHDPTTRDRQGADEGPQYRSIVLAHDEAQRKTAEAVKARLDASGEFAAPIVTEIVPFRRFWPAEGYHQDYFSGNPRQPYCRVVIEPKVRKFEKAFSERLKKER